jgi:uncharacterized protein (TIGR02145 family)
MKKLLLLSLILIFGCKKSDDGTVEVIPLPPAELKATLISKDQVDLTWKDNSTNETGFKIERKTDSGNFSEIGSSATDVTTFSDKTVSLNTNYTYRVYSFNQVGKSISYSNEVTIKTINLPALTTYQITAISYQGASSGGQINSDGGSAVTANGVVWDTSTNPTIALSTKTSDGTGSGAFKSSITGLKALTKYYVRAFATNSAGTSYGNELSFTTDAYIVAPTLTTNTISDILSNSVKSGGTISADGGSAVTARGVVWDTSTNPRTDLSTKTSDGTGIGSYQSSITGLKENTKYYLRAYAINSTWIGYGNEVSFTTPAAVSPSFNTVVGANGKIWMDRNLGATRVATSSADAEAYGDLYQWGRGKDGHQSRTSTTTTTLSSADQPKNGSFILNTTLDDWRSPQNDNLWQGVSGTNNPCPSGYRLPTNTELENERKSWTTNARVGAFYSVLKLPLAGYRSIGDGSLINVGTNGVYWSSTVGNGGSQSLYCFEGGSANMGTSNRASGLSVRCIKD